MHLGRAWPWTLLLLAAADECSCRCCTVGLDNTAASGDTVAQCHVILATDDRFLSATGSACPATCSRGENDEVLATAREVDFERFCAYECAPKKPLDGAPCLPTEGRPTADGNGDVEQVMVPVAFHATARREPASWPTVSHGAHEVGARAEDAGKAVRSREEAAELSSELATRVTTRAASAVPHVEAIDASAEESATRASDVLRSAQALAEAVPKQASEAAHDVMAETIEALDKEAQETAKQEAFKAAAELEKKMKAQIPEAKAKAEAPFMEAMNRAAGVAGDYAKAGDGASGLSFNENLQAGQLFGQAAQFQTLGDVAKAQNLMRDAHNLVALAKQHAGAANGLYGTASSIMSSLGGYAPQAAAAAYHAEVMLNPDAPPPPPPLIK